MVGSETSWTALSDEEKALRRPLMLDSLQRIAEEAVRLDAVFGVEPVAIHPLCSRKFWPSYCRPWMPRII